MTDSEIQTLQNLSDEGFSFCKTVLQEENLPLDKLLKKYSLSKEMIDCLLYGSIGDLTVNELIETIFKINSYK